jgi:hypothetical protein
MCFRRIIKLPLIKLRLLLLLLLLWWWLARCLL